MSFNLINEANFFVVFIALIIVFFLVGLILGRLINRPKKDAKDKVKKPLEEDNEASGQTDTLGQDNPDNMEQPYSGQNQRPRDYRSRYHDNYW